MDDQFDVIVVGACPAGEVCAGRLGERRLRIAPYVGDREPGQILRQNVQEFGGTWRVVRGGGTLVD